jgi:hypothetical protein
MNASEMKTAVGTYRIQEQVVKKEFLRSKDIDVSPGGL